MRDMGLAWFKRSDEKYVMPGLTAFIGESSKIVLPKLQATPRRAGDLREIIHLEHDETPITCSFYLSAASFLGICGMIAISGYDGFLYSIGYLAGWVVALFVVAEPMKRMGKYTFTDALDAKFNSKGIQLISAISTLLVSIFYLIPQMVGAGSLVTPLLGLPHWAGVLIVGLVVTAIVATAGMTSTTYVQFLKGTLLIIFSLVLVFLVFSRGISTKPDQGGEVPYHEFVTIKVRLVADGKLEIQDEGRKLEKDFQVNAKSGTVHYYKLSKNDETSFWKLNENAGVLEETLHTSVLPDGTELFIGIGWFDFRTGFNSFIPGNVQQCISFGECDCPRTF